MLSWCVDKCRVQLPQRWSTKQSKMVLGWCYKTVISPSLGCPHLRRSVKNLYRNERILISVCGSQVTHLTRWVFTSYESVKVGFYLLPIWQGWCLPASHLARWVFTCYPSGKVGVYQLPVWQGRCLQATLLAGWVLSSYTSDKMVLRFSGLSTW